MMSNFDVWKSVYDISLGQYFMNFFLIIILTVLTIIVLNKIYVKGKESREEFLIHAVIALSLIVILGTFILTTPPGFTREEEMVINKVKDEFTVKRIEFVERDKDKYEIIVDRDEEYTVNISTYGEHVETIYKGEKEVYTATEENIDEGAYEGGRKALKKVRDISGNKDAKIKEQGFYGYTIKSGKEIYEVGMDNREVSYVIKKNEEYLYEKQKGEN